MDEILNNYDSITEHEFRLLGIDIRDPGIVDAVINIDKPYTIKDLDELRKYHPPAVITRCIRGFNYTQNSYLININADKEYVMFLRMYNNVCCKDNTRLFSPSDVIFKNVYNPYIGQDISNKTLLVWGMGGYGDILFTQPCLIYLKEEYPTCKIIFACEYKFHSWLQTWNCIDEVIGVPFLYEYMVNSDYQAFTEGIFVKPRQAKTENIYKLYAQWFGLDLPDELLVPKLEPTVESMAKCEKLLSEWNLNKKSFLIIQMTASSLNRIPRLSIWRKLINILIDKGYTVLISDNPARSDMIDRFIGTLNRPDKVFNFAKYSESVSDLIAMASLAKLAISPDSALVHIAVAVGTKAFGIYGTFPGRIRLSTYKNCDWIDCKADCAPCYTHEYDNCPNLVDRHPICYDNLDINEAIDKIERLLSE